MKLKCQFCDKDVLFPLFVLIVVNYFAGGHQLPENHECPELPKEPRFWWQKRKLAEEQEISMRGKIGICPDCGSGVSDMVDYNAKTMTFVCKRCEHKWIQLKAFPHDIIKSKDILELKKEQKEEPKKSKKRRWLFF